MGIALLALSGFFKSLTSASRQATVIHKHRPARIHPVWAKRPHHCTPTAPLASRPTVPSAQLRVLRVHESDQRTECAGRMVISGRMADVCAELDRLVALEAAQLQR